MGSFETALKKGEIGEKIIYDLLERKGWVVYCPFTKNKAHRFDILATKNKEKAIAIDVKTKARMNYWNATGVNIKSYKEYLIFMETTKIPFFLIFIDEKLGTIHSLDLRKETPSFNPTTYIIAWYIDDMKYIGTISDDQKQEISQYDQRSYEFKPSDNGS